MDGDPTRREAERWNGNVLAVDPGIIQEQDADRPDVDGCGEPLRDHEHDGQGGHPFAADFAPDRMDYEEKPDSLRQAP